MRCSANRLEITGTGDFINDASPVADYPLTLEGLASLIVTGDDLVDVSVTLEPGTALSPTLLQCANVVGGDWFIKHETRVEISGNVDATGYKTWSVGEELGLDAIRGGILRITGDTLGGAWALYGNDPDADPFPELRVDGVIEGGCWDVFGKACYAWDEPGNPHPDPDEEHGYPRAPQSQWLFREIKDGPDACLVAEGGMANRRAISAGIVSPLSGSVGIHGGRWQTDDAQPLGKFPSVVGGVWNRIHKTSKTTLGGTTYFWHVTSMNLDAPVDESCSDQGGPGNNCSLFADDLTLVIGGPGNSSIPSLKYTPDGQGCGIAWDDTGSFSPFARPSIETADASGATGTLTVGILVMKPSGLPQAPPTINLDSNGATQTDLVIEKSAYLENVDIKAKSLTVDNPDVNGSSLVEIHSPTVDGVKIESIITLAGPADFGANRRCEIEYHNKMNTIRCRKSTGTSDDGFTLGPQSVIRAGSSTAELDIEVAGDFDIKTEFGAFTETIPPKVAQFWGSRTTDLTMTRFADDCTVEMTLELYAHDSGDVVFSDTPCKGT